MDIQKLLYIDRRIIYLLVAIGALVPIIKPIGLPVVPTDPVQGLFDKLESLDPGDAVIISYDYGPSSEPELNPMAEAIMRHCFTKDLRVMIMAILRAKEAKGMSTEELEKQMQQLHTELSRERGSVASGTQAENPGKIRETRKTIARIKTILHERGVKK